MERVIVRCDAEGLPECVICGVREWEVAAPPVKWFERTSWWSQQRRMPVGGGRVDVEVWRVQVRLGSNPSSALATMELVRDGLGGGWMLRAMAVDCRRTSAA